MAHILSIISLAIILYVNYARGMKKLTLLFATVLLTNSLVACSNEPNENSAVFETIEIPATILPTIDMVATHAIDLDTSISQLTFVPNSVAPWLGRIIIRDDDGFLFSTDIEGREPKPVGTGKYIDIFGLAREAAPGVFLTITEDNKIEAYIESDDIGNFSPMIYSGERIDAKGFCLSHTAATKAAKILTVNNEFKNISISIEDKHLEQTIRELNPGIKKVMEKNPELKNIHECVFSSDKVGPEWALSYETEVKKVNETGRGFITPIEESNDQSGSRHHPFQLEVSKTDELLINFSEYIAIIKNGLSVRGVDHIKYVATTSANYGGGAYSKGVLALVDADEQRIVFISLSYAERQLLKAVNQPEDAPQ